MVLGFLYNKPFLLIQMRIIVTFLCANSDVNYNYILVSKDVLQLSGKKSDCPVNVELPTHGN